MQKQGECSKHKNPFIGVQQGENRKHSKKEEKQWTSKKMQKSKPQRGVLLQGDQKPEHWLLFSRNVALLKPKPKTRMSQNPGNQTKTKVSKSGTFVRYRWRSGAAASYPPRIGDQPQVRLGTCEDPGCHAPWWTKTSTKPKPKQCRNLTVISVYVCFCLFCFNLEITVTA